MEKEAKFKIENINSLDQKISIEAEIEVLDGVDGINVNQENGNCHVRFDDSKISETKIIEKIQGLGFKVLGQIQAAVSGPIKEHTYFVKGMHCASCEILIEKKLLKFPEVKSVDASTNKGEVIIEYQGNRPNPHRLNKIFDEEHYAFFDKSKGIASPQAPRNDENKNRANPTLVAFNIAIFVIIGFLILDKMGIANFLAVGTKSSLLTFFGFGLLAGLSSCAALVGGIVLSMSKQWQSLYGEADSTSKKLQPHIMFNAGRLISYIVLGGILGIIGSRLQISPQITGFLVVAISFLMIALGLQMLGVKAFRKFQLTMPKAFTRYAADEKNFQGKQMPFVMGALTFFLPCGFTITAQSLALLSGSPITGAMIMGAFALGTIPSLLFIGLSSVKFSSKPHLAERFAKVAGFLVLFFALYNISNQATVLGFKGFGNFLARQTQTQTALAQVVDGKQVIQMTASGSGDDPNYFKVRAGVPVRWEITGGSSTGCNGAIIANGLYDGAIDIIPGQVTIKEFTPQNPGRYTFSCTMGMIRGTMDVVDANAAANDSNATVAAATAPSQPSGATCGGGGGGCGCGGGANIKKDATPTQAQVQGNTQVINATYTAGKYLSPNNLTVKVGTKVRLLIDVKDNGQGCGNAIKIPGLYDNAQPLTAGNKIAMEFTPTSAGNYSITCGMGMIRFGSIQVN